MLYYPLSDPDIAAIAIGAFYNFRMGGGPASTAFAHLEFPAWLRYSQRDVDALRRSRLRISSCGNRGGAALLLLLLYPITLIKMALATLITLGCCYQNFGSQNYSCAVFGSSNIDWRYLARSSSQCSLLSRSRIILTLSLQDDRHSVDRARCLQSFFRRTIRPAFARVLLKRLVSCPIPILVDRDKPTARQFQCLLFATEGVASVSLILAPLAVFACGLVIRSVTTSSSQLPRFILVSRALLPQICQHR